MKMTILKSKLDDSNYQKLMAINNTALHNFIAKYVELCNPEQVFVASDLPGDIHYIRKAAIKLKEERELAISGHTIHFDGNQDQARDQKNTNFLLSGDVKLGPNINSVDKEKGLVEINSILKNIMSGKILFVQFFCLGPLNSDFSMPAVQLTDSSYVAHSQNLLYRQGYQEFKKLGNPGIFFKFVHSAGELVGGVSKNIDRRRIYIDTQEDIVYSMNTQYGGNTIGHKKLAMRLAINKASEQHWLTEHMFLMGVHGPKGRISYFTGAFPSLCGKTATSMLSGESIVGDDIVYIRKMGEEIRAVNVEKGMFGIIQGINSKDDPLVWKALNSPGEIIFSNSLLTKDKDVYWVGKDGKIPERGITYCGEWSSEKTDADGNKIPASHRNARFTLSLELLENLDPELDNPQGVIVKGIIYGGRDY